MSSLDHQFTGNITDRAVEGQKTFDAPRWIDWSSLSAKLNTAVLGTAAVLALVTVVLLSGVYYLGQYGRTMVIVSSVEVHSSNAAIALANAVDGLEEASAAKNNSTRTQAVDEASAALGVAYATLSEPIATAGASMPIQPRAAILSMRTDIADLRARLDGELNQTALVKEANRARDLFRTVSAFALQTHEGAETSVNQLYDAIGWYLIICGVVVAVGVCASLIGARLIIRNVVSSVRAITRAMQALANGDTNVIIPGHTRRDELGEMAHAMTVFQSSTLALRDLTADRARDAESQLARQQEAYAEAQSLRAEQSAVLSDLATGFEVSVGEVIASVQSAADTLRTTSKGMVDLAQGSVAQSSEATDAMETATRNVTAAAAATDEFALSITEISQQATASASLAREANELVGSANTKMSDLSEAAQEVGEIAGLIQTIAQRTNLLALNASIEAARGGEAGRGFAVVASEVKELATQTSQATSSVAEKIAAIQNSTAASAKDLGAIVHQIAKLEEASVVIASAVDQQSRSGEDLARNIDTVAAGSAGVGERLHTLKEASHKTGQAAGDVLKNAEDLGLQADTLQAKAGQFIAQVQRSSADLLVAGGTSSPAKARE